MKYTFIIVLIATSTLVFAQDVTTWNDSRQLPVEENEYNEYIKLFKSKNYIRSIEKADSLKNYYVSIEDWNSYYFYLNNIIRTMYIMGNYKGAIEKYNSDFSICQNKIDTISGEYIFGLLNLYSCNNRIKNSEQKYYLAKILLNTCIENNQKDSLEFFTLNQITGGLANYEDFQAAYKSLFYAFKIAKANNWDKLINTSLSTFAGYVTMIDKKNNIALFFYKNAFLKNPMNRLKDSLDYITDARLLASSCYENGDYEISIDYCEKGLLINDKVSFKKYHDSWYSDLTIALLRNYLAVERNEEAYSLSEKVENLLIKNKDYYLLVYLYLSIADNELLNNNYTKAVLAAKKAKPILDSAYVTDLYFWNAYYSINSQASYRLGEFKKSYSIAHKGILKLANNNDTLVSFDSIPGLKDPSYSDQYMELIKMLFKSSVEICKQNIDYNIHERVISLFEIYDNIYSIEIRENTDSYYIERLQHNYKEMLDALTDYFAFNHASNKKVNYKYYAQCLANYKGKLLKWQMEQSLNLSNSIEDSEIEQLKSEILQQESELKIAELNNDFKGIDQISNNLSELYLTLLYKESLYKTKTYKLINFTYENIDSICSRLGDNEAILNFFIADSIISTNLLTKKGSFIDFKTNSNININLRNFNYSIKTGSNEELKNSSTRIYNSIFKAHEDALENIKSICVIPDVKFAQLPIDALLDSSHDPMIKKYNFYYSYALHLPVKKISTETTSLSSILLSAPVYKSNKIIASNSFRSSILNDSLLFRSNNELMPLPYTKKECVSISKLFEKEGVSSTILLGTQASKTRLLKEIKNTQIVHLATHGIVNKQNPYISGIALSPSDTNLLKDDILYHYELYNLEKLNLNLIVLSACQTGVGELLEGEGALALPRGFIYAGVPNVIASLWKVHDEKTKDLMVAFYKHLLEDKVSYAEALRLAKLDCIKKGFLPLDWAGFILIGE